ncbi:hypothetical protein EJB05_19481 [Eragrostis curvula]|uniref:THUMP domain-containing protein n=1 Tax=Eragrostis curvula TaxID=38414 RepID=A0A5J9UWK5_9POAL|nr:hypothetical protein EJB05_19481 [Eragrostis curvula]
MAAPEQEAKPEAVTPSPAREPPPESHPDAPSSSLIAGQELQPWEQHAAVINLPRYDYRASGSLLLRSCSGFLITCPIKREKSATKEAISILDKYIGRAAVLENSEPCDVKIAAKKRKLCSETSENTVEAATNGHNDASESTGSIGNSNSPESKTSEDVDKTSKLSLVKLSRSGLLFFKFPSGGFHVVQMLTEMLHSLKSGKLKSPQ